MRIQIDLKALHAEVPFLKQAANASRDYPSFNNARFFGAKNSDSVLVGAGCKDLSVFSKVPATIKTGGSFSVPIPSLCHLPSNGPVSIETTPKSGPIFSVGNLNLALDRTTADHVEKLKEPKSLAMVEGLKAVLPAILRSISCDPHKYPITGALFEFSKDGLTFCSTDGHRLTHGAIEGRYSNFQVIIPRLVLRMMLRMPDEPWGFALGEQLMVRQNDRTMLVRRVDGRFPDYSKAIPKPEAWVVFDREELLGAAKNLASIADDRCCMAVVKTSSRGTSLSIKNHGTGEHMMVSLARQGNLQPAQGGPREFRLGINARYLLDMAAICKCEYLKMGIVDEETIYTFIPDHDRFRHIISPMRLTG